MKKHLIRTLSIAAVLAVGAAAYASNYVNANIPFPFKMNGKALPAGTYHLAPASAASGAIALRGQDTSAFAIGTPAVSDEMRGRLLFRCGEVSGCALTEVWNSDGRGWLLKTPRITPVEKERLAVIYTDQKKAD